MLSIHVVFNSGKAFTLSENEFDQSTYWGRVRQFVKQTNPLNLLVTSTQLKEAQDNIEYFKNNGKIPPNSTDASMWKARNIIAATIHPDTKEKILLPFRLSAFVPMNILIIAGMIGARTTASTVFWQGINQTYNVCVNHSNRNASNPVTNSELLTNYLAAVVSSVGTAVGLNEAVKRSTLSAVAKERLLMTIPMIAVIAANICNIGLMRRAEMTLGINIKDEDGEIIGKSAIAGKYAVASTILSRVVLVIPGMLGPPIIMNTLEKNKSIKNLFTRSPLIKNVANISIIALMIQLSLPLAIGLFPQYSTLPLTSLEPEFHNHKLKDGRPGKFAEYNKGL